MFSSVQLLVANQYPMYIQAEPFNNFKLISSRQTCCF